MEIFGNETWKVIALGRTSSPASSRARRLMEELVEEFGRFREGSWFLWPMQLLPTRRREAMYALYAFCREVDDIADGETSRSLKQTLLLNWRSEIADLFAGRPQHDVTRGLSEAIHLY